MSRKIMCIEPEPYWLTAQERATRRADGERDDRVAAV